MPPNRRGNARDGAPSNTGFATVNRFALALSDDEDDADTVAVPFEQEPAIDLLAADDVVDEESIVDAQPVEDSLEEGFVVPRRRPQRAVALPAHQESNDDQRSVPQNDAMTYRNHYRRRRARAPEFGPEFVQGGKWMMRHIASGDLWVFEHDHWRRLQDPYYQRDAERPIETTPDPFYDYDYYEMLHPDPFERWRIQQEREEREERWALEEARRNVPYSAEQRRRLIPVDPQYYHNRSSNNESSPPEANPSLEYEDEPVPPAAAAELPAAPLAVNRNRRRRDRRERDPLRRLIDAPPAYVAPPAPPTPPVAPAVEEFEEFEPVDAPIRNPVAVDQGKQARLKREREENNEPARLAVRYSRECGICNAPNPRIRVISMCGHILCSPCSEELEDVGPGVKCPFCRKTTTYIRMYEQEVEEAEDEGAPTGTIEA